MFDKFTMFDKILREFMRLNGKIAGLNADLARFEVYEYINVNDLWRLRELATILKEKYWDLLKNMPAERFDINRTLGLV